MIKEYKFIEESIYEPRSLRTFLPITWKKAKNDIVWDMDNKKYIDFTSTIFVQNVGHSNKGVIKAIKKQCDKNLLHSYIYNNETRQKYVKKLINYTPDYLEKVYLMSSGTEATEAACKLMRAYTGKNKILSFKGSMHGRTMAAECLKGSGIYEHVDFIPLPYPTDEEYIISKQCDMASVDQNKIAGIIIESYQGWSARMLPEKVVENIILFCKRNHIMLCFDEIQSGFYRTGKLFAYQHYDVKPDLVCIGKGMGGGLPLSGVLGRKEILDVMNTGDMSSTHSANPLVCAAGIAVLKELDKIVKGDEFLKNMDLLKKEISHIAECNSIQSVVNGMVASLIFEDKDTANKVCIKCYDNGLLVVQTGRESVKIGPPLSITNKHLQKGLNILRTSVSECVH